MANWHSDTIVSDFDVNESVDTMVSERGKNREEFVERAFVSDTGRVNDQGRRIVSFDIGGLGSSVVGINANQIPIVVSAIDTYINRIKSYIDNLDPVADAKVAFKSEAVIKSLANYMNNVKTYVMNLISTLRAFEDKLIDVKTKWETYAGNLGETINTTTGDNFAMGSEYVRQFQTPDVYNPGSSTPGRPSFEQVYFDDGGSYSGNDSGASAGGTVTTPTEGTTNPTSGEGL